jgi:hypothetical protein
MIQGLIVEIIRILWDHGLYLDNPWLQRIYDNWFSYWVEYKTKQSMDEVDKQIEEMFLESEIDPPIFSEEKEGETPLGGILELRSPWADEEDND